jgi:hypothetical protein
MQPSEIDTLASDLATALENVTASAGDYVKAKGRPGNRDQLCLGCLLLDLADWLQASPNPVSQALGARLTFEPGGECICQEARQRTPKTTKGA